MKSIQQILEEQRSLSKINEVTEAHINRSLANEWKKDNSEFSETMKQVASQRDEVYHEKRRQGLAKRDNSYQAIDNARTEKQAQISKSLKENYTKTIEHLARVAAKNKERSKPIQTPYGQFESRKAAVICMNARGIVNAGKKLDKFLKTDQTNYFYLDQK